MSSNKNTPGRFHAPTGGDRHKANQSHFKVYHQEVGLSMSRPSTFIMIGGHPPTEHPDIAHIMLTGYPPHMHPENQDTPEARLEFIEEHTELLIEWLRLNCPDVLDGFLLAHDNEYRNWLN